MGSQSQKCKSYEGIAFDKWGQSLNCSGILFTTGFYTVSHTLITDQENKLKCSGSRRREFRGMRSAYLRLSKHEMKRNAKIGLFTKPSKIEIFRLNGQGIP
jgi:hypothetical protein